MGKKTYPLVYGGEKQNFAQSCVVGDVVLCSGAGARTYETGRVDTDDPYEQTIYALNKVKRGLETAGTSLENIAKITIYMPHIRAQGDRIWFQAVMDYVREHAPSLAKDMPACTAIGVTSLFPMAPPSHQMAVEIDVIAAMPGRKKTHPLVYGGEKQTFAQSCVIGDLVLCSGAGARTYETGRVDTADPYEQTIYALNKIKRGLEASGTSLENIAKITIYMPHIVAQGDRIWFQAVMDYFRQHAPSLAKDMPACTAVGVSSLFPMEPPSHQMAVEIDVIAAMPGRKKTHPLVYGGEKQTFAQSCVVGDLVLCSGAGARTYETGRVDTADPSEQTIYALNKIKRGLEAAGTSLENIAKWIIYMPHIVAQGKTIEKAWMDYIREHAPSLAEDMPACTAVGVTSLFPMEPPSHQMVVEIDVIAAMPD